VASVFARAALTAGVGPPVTPTAVLDALHRGEGPRIVDGLLPPGLDRADRAADALVLLRDCLAALVAVPLLRVGLARFQLAWPGPPTLERRDRAAGWTAWDGGELVAEAVTTPDGALRLRAWLARVGADLGTVIEPAPEPPPRPLSAIAGAELIEPTGGRPVDVVVYTTGLLLASAPAPTAWAGVLNSLVGGTSRVAADRVVSLGERAGSRPDALPDARWIPAEAVRDAALPAGRTGPELQLLLVDGSRATVRDTPHTVLRGTPVDDLRRVLAGRCDTRPDVPA
jgi:hypothetical protein